MAKRSKKKKGGGKPDFVMSPETARSAIRLALRYLTNLSLVYAEFEKQYQDNPVALQNVRAARKEVDENLGIALRENTIVKHLVKTTESPDLFHDALTDALHVGEHLPLLIERFEQHFAEPADLNEETSDSVYFKFAQSVLLQVECLEELSEKHPERFHLIAHEMPCWPLRVFRHRKAYAKRFDRLADRLELGKGCPIHSSGSAEYTFEKPINAFVFKVLSEFLRVHGYLNSRDKHESLEKACTSAGIPLERQAPFIAAHALPRLTKGAVAKAWAEKAIIPHLEMEHPDWNSVPALQEFLGKAGGRAKAKEALKSALESMAWPG